MEVVGGGVVEFVM